MPTVTHCPKCGKAVQPASSSSSAPSSTPPSSTPSTGSNNSGPTIPAPKGSFVEKPSAPPTDFKPAFERCFAHVLESGSFSGDYESRFSDPEKQELMAYFATYDLPDKPPAIFKRENTKLTRAQKILLAGIMHVNDRREEPGKWGSKPGHWPNERQRVARANCCGHWAKRVWEYSGIRTAHSSDAKWKRYLPWKEQKEEWKRRWTPFDFEMKILPQTQAITFERYKAIKTGDYLCVKWRNSARGSNHAFLFIKWAGGRDSQRKRRALIMDQANNKIGGGNVRKINLSCESSNPPYLYATRTPKPYGSGS